MIDTPPIPSPQSPQTTRQKAGTRSRMSIAIGIGLILLVLFIFVGLFLAARPPEDQIQGMVEAETFTVATKVPSRVETIFTHEGETVTAGQEMALLSSPEVDAKDIQARALLQSTQAVQSMSRDGARTQDIRSVESIWHASQATAELAIQTARRAEVLFAEGVISAQRAMKPSPRATPLLPKPKLPASNI